MKSILYSIAQCTWGILYRKVGKSAWGASDWGRVHWRFGVGLSYSENGGHNHANTNRGSGR